MFTVFQTGCSSHSTISLPDCNEGFTIILEENSMISSSTLQWFLLFNGGLSVISVHLRGSCIMLQTETAVPKADKKKPHTNIFLKHTNSFFKKHFFLLINWEQCVFWIVFTFIGSIRVLHMLARQFLDGNLLLNCFASGMCWKGQSTVATPCIYYSVGWRHFSFLLPPPYFYIYLMIWTRNSHICQRIFTRGGVYVMENEFRVTLTSCSRSLS